MSLTVSYMFDKLIPMHVPNKKINCTSFMKHYILFTKVLLNFCRLPINVLFKTHGYILKIECENRTTKEKENRTRKSLRRKT